MSPEPPTRAYEGKPIGARRLSAVVLAAGGGRRFGGAKLTTPWRGGVLLDGALAAACAAPVREVIVVTGSDPAVELATRAFAAHRSEGPTVRFAVARDWSEGLAASLRAGLSSLAADVEGAFIFLGDMPSIPHAVAASLAGRLSADVDAVQPTFKGEPGHPVLLGRSLFAAAQAITGDQGARSLLAGAKVVRLEIDAPGLVRDVDTREALQTLAGQPS